MANKNGRGGYWTTETSNRVAELDVKTNNIIKMKQTKVYHSQREFIMVYFDCIEELTGRLEDGCYSILFAIWKYSYFPNDSGLDGNKFNNDKGFKEECKKLGINKSDRAINTAVYRLAQKGIIMPISKGIYMLNPKYFAKGNLNDNSEINLELKYRPQLPPNQNAE